jgi:hypothetical protein
MAGLSKLTPGAFVLELLHAGTNAHMLHLRTDSYAEHKALGTFYEEIVGLTDSFAEAYQGRYELVDFPAVPFVRENDAITQLKQLRKYVDENRRGLCSESEIQNIIDEIVSLIDSTLYKLRFLS